MEKISIGPVHGRISRGILAHLGLVAILAVTGLAGGCDKGKTPVAQVAADQNTNQTSTDQAPVSQPSSSAVPQTAASAQAPAEPDLKELNRSLLRWILANRRRPQSFEDFAATSGVTIPQPPSGKKYFLGKDMHIVLVDR